MKPEIHPKYRQVVFRDVSCDFEFLTRSTIQAKQTTTYEGKEYPLVVIDISSQSHPFYTGTQKILDTAGRVERFYRKYGFKQELEEMKAEETGTEE
jgi:large subunit ribosomal protein L31